MQRKKGSTNGWVPNHHGAWAMLVLPYLLAVGWAIRAGEFTWAVAWLGPTWIIGYFAFFAAATWLKSRFKPRYRSATFTYVAIVAVCAVVLLLMEPTWWGWGLVFGPLTGVGLWQAWRRQERSLVSGFVTVAAACLVPLVVGSKGPLALGGIPVLLGVGLACFGYFFGTVLYVKTNIRERGRVDFIGYSVAWHLACAIGFAVWELGLPRWALVVFFLLATVRALVVPVRALRGAALTVKQLGRSEIAVTLALAVLLGVGVLSG